MWVMDCVWGREVKGRSNDGLRTQWISLMIWRQSFSPAPFLMLYLSMVTSTSALSHYDFLAKDFLERRKIITKKKKGKKKNRKALCISLAGDLLWLISPRGHCLCLTLSFDDFGNLSSARQRKATCPAFCWIKMRLVTDFQKYKQPEGSHPSHETPAINFSEESVLLAVTWGWVGGGEIWAQHISVLYANDIFCHF